MARYLVNTIFQAVIILSLVVAFLHISLWLLALVVL